MNERGQQMNAEFVVTATKHQNCPKCLAYVESAETQARVTGSNGATYGNGNCFARVARVEAVAR